MVSKFYLAMNAMKKVSFVVFFEKWNLKDSFEDDEKVDDKKIRSTRGEKGRRINYI